MTEQQMKSISVEDLFSSGKISKKTYNTLVRARMRTAFDLKRYESGLSRLFRAGTSGMREISILLAEFSQTDNLPMSASLFPEFEPQVSDGEQLMASLSPKETQLLEVAYKNVLRKLQSTHERTSTKIANVLFSIPISIFVRDYLLEEDERILMLNEVGEATMQQVAQVKDVIKNELQLVREKQVPVEYRLYYYQAGGLLDDDAFVMDYFIKNGHLPLLYLIQKWLIEKKDTQVVKAFLQRYDIFGGKVDIDLEKIKKSSFTITTYSNTIFDALFDKDGSAEPLGSFFLGLFADKKNCTYLEDVIHDEFIAADNEGISQLIAEEQLLMTPVCVIAILGKLMAGNYASLGGYPRSFGAAVDERWKNAYLVPKEWAAVFDFQKQMWRFRDDLVRNSTEIQSVDVLSFVKEVLDDTVDEDLVLRLTAAFVRILVDELSLETEEGKPYGVVIQKAKDKTLADRLYIILENSKKPMMLDDLTSCINSGDGRRYVRASVSLALNKDPRFQGSGKKGCYALREWDLPYFGSNADIVYAVLDEADRPMKGEEIVAVLSQYEYNKQFSKNDLSSVVSIGKSLFRKLGLGFYGLVGREYDPEESQPARHSFEGDLEAYENFIDTHGKAPSVKGGDEERRLAAWFLRKRKEWEGENNWLPRKREAFSQLITKCDSLLNASPTLIMEVEDTEKVSTPYEGLMPSVETPAEELLKEELLQEEQPQEEQPQEDPLKEEVVVPIQDEQVVADWENRWQAVKAFVEKNGREPLEMFTVEVNLAQWLSQQKNLMRQGSLNEQQRSAMLLIRDLLW